MITTGKKIARTAGARFIQAEKGTLGIEVAFRFKDGETEEKMNWVGWLSPAAIENTMKTLVEALDFNGDDTIDPATNMLNAGALNKEKDVELVIDTEEYEGKSRLRIKWVNAPGGGPGFKTLAAPVAKAHLDNLGFKAYFNLQKQGSGKAAPVPAALNSMQQPKGPIAEADLPF